MKTEKIIQTTLSLYENDRSRLKYISQVNREYIRDTLKSNGMSGAVRFLLERYNDKGTDIKTETPVSSPPDDFIIEPDDGSVDNRFEIMKEPPADEDVEPDSTLDGILKRMIELPFVLPLMGYPRELIYSEAKIKRDHMAVKLRKAITHEINKVKDLRKYQVINDRIESGNAQPEDFNPQNGLQYGMIKNEIMSNRVNQIFPWAALVHHFNCIVNHNKKFYNKDHIGSVYDIEEDPFTKFAEDADERVKNMVIDFDPEVMFNEMLDKPTYDKHMMRLGEIYKK